MELKNLDLLIGEVRKTKTPLNRTSIREFAVDYMVKGFSNEEGEILLTDLVKAIRESREKTELGDLGTIKF